MKDLQSHTNNTDLFCNLIKNSSYNEEMNEKKYIFLDIDGVLATTRQFYSKKINVWNTYDFDKKCVKVLNEILDESKAIIILSSDWKYHYDLDTMNMIFAGNGIKTMISAFTPSLWDVKYFKLQELEACRSEEIIKYATKHKMEKWVAIDDLDMGKILPEENFIHTPRAMEGIKQSGIKQKILKKLL